MKSCQFTQLVSLGNRSRQMCKEAVKAIVWKIPVPIYDFQVS